MSYCMYHHCTAIWQLSFCKRINVWNERSRTEHALCVCMCVYTCMCVNECVNERLNVRDSAVVAYAFDINQLSLPTPFFLFCSRVCFCLYGPFNCISFNKFCRQLSAFSLCSSSLMSVLLVLSTICLLWKSPSALTWFLVIDCAQSTNELTNCCSYGLYVQSHTLPFVCTL